MMRHGYIGNAPLHPSCTFSIQLLRLYRTLANCTPQLSIIKFARSLCDLHHDVYVEIQTRISCDIQNQLGHEDNWQLRNACPPCTYVLEDEPPLKYSIQATFDGNNSLKRIPKSLREKDSTGKVVSIESLERPDGRQRINGFYLTPGEVDKFSSEVKRRLPKVNITSNPCVERWKNLADDAVKKMWGIFDETGIFLAVCRHGTALLMCDMIKSGELAKYPLAIVNKLIDVFGVNLLLGYDIGCGFSVTVNKSALVGPKVRSSGCQFCVGYFHGHAHCRCGLEDFEGCERAFAESNAVAGPTRHASKFHRKQAILLHFERWNADKYAELSKFICNNYRQALKLLAELPPKLEAMKIALNIPSDTTFIEWHNEEKEYLRGIKQEPETNKLRYEYLSTLCKLHEAIDRYAAVTQQWHITSLSDLECDNFYSMDNLHTRGIETSQVKGLDSVLTLQGAVEDLEGKLGIGRRWTPESAEWKLTEEKLAMREYQLALNKLEGLVVSRLFELTKLNQSGIGVKLRTQIAKGLKARSQAIRTAVNNYNTAAACISPPRDPLDITQFDLLRDGSQDIFHKPWIKAAEREASIAYFKIQRAHEEIQRLNIEISRLKTFICDEEHELALAYQLHKILLHWKAINTIHYRRYSGGKGIGIRKGKIPEDGIEEEKQWSSYSESDFGDSSDNEPSCNAVDATIHVISLDD
ncbi:hypothetical protein BU17DRAFT_75910 [Hysterangium stoloniferum]|nr:hypothetical protein BU17DRAFT_75910 [Hysterangium stoloniferum]